jgi:hypothetical protein
MKLTPWGCSGMAACGSIRSFVRTLFVQASARQRRARAGCSASLQRSSLRSDCLAVLGRVARRRTHFAHFARCVQTGGDKSVHKARCARGPRALRSSALQRRCAACPGTPLQTQWGCSCDRGRCLSGRRHPARAISVAMRSAGPRSARVSALRQLTRGGCLNAVSEANEVSSAARPRNEHRSAVGAKRRPPQHEPTPGAACRDAPTLRMQSGRQPTSATGRERTAKTIAALHASQKALCAMGH